MKCARLAKYGTCASVSGSTILSPGSRSVHAATSATRSADLASVALLACTGGNGLDTGDLTVYNPVMKSKPHRQPPKKRQAPKVPPLRGTVTKPGNGGRYK